MYYKTFKVRLFPTKDQEKMLWKHIHTCRAFWNFMLELNIDTLNSFNKRLSYYEMCKIITTLKEYEEMQWLNDVSLHSLQRVCDNLNDAYQKHFKNPKNYGYPKFKGRKKSVNSFPISSYNAENRFISNDCIKICRCGRIKCRFNYRTINFDKIKDKPFLNPQITFTNNGKWILTFSLEHENQVFKNKNNSLGLDMGIKDAAIYSYKDKDGIIHSDTIENLNKDKKLKKLDYEIIKLERIISRKYRTSKRLGYEFRSSNRYRKTVNKLRKLYYHRMNIIKDYYHKSSSHIVYDIHPSFIFIEDLNISGLLKNRRVSKNIAYVSWYSFQIMLQYKAERIGIPICKVPRFYPSSQICSNCGSIHKLKLSERTYFCPDCGLIIDRDINASINLMNYNQGLYRFS